MITLRCTKRLFAHLDERPAAEELAPSSALGDWYANLIPMPAGPPYYLAMNERSLLCVVLPHDADLLPAFRRRAVALLRRIGAPTETVEREAFHLQRIQLGKTRNRRVLGTMNDAAWNLESMLFDAPRRRFSLDRVEDELAATPFSVIGYAFPGDAALALLGAPVQRKALGPPPIAARQR
jgi:hypothetical protein